MAFEECISLNWKGQIMIKPHTTALWSEYILSHVQGPVTNNNGFWTGWLDLLALLLQLHLIITSHNGWLPKILSIPYWTTSVFSSIVTDLVLIYEGHFFSFRCPLVNTPQLNTQSRLHSDWRLSICPPFITPGRTEYWTLSPTVHVIPYLSVVT
jgi:hypothetical protein